MQHLSRCQRKNKLPIDASIWNTVRTNFKLRRLLYTILFWIGKAESTDIRLSQLNSNWELKWLCNCWQTVALENKHIVLTKHQIPCFSLILHYEKHQQVEGKALFNSVQFMRSAFNEQSDSAANCAAMLIIRSWQLNLSIATYDLAPPPLLASTTQTTTVLPKNLSLVNELI